MIQKKSDNLVSKRFLTLLALWIGLSSLGCWEGQKPNPLKRMESTESKSTTATPDTAKKTEIGKPK